MSEDLFGFIGLGNMGAPMARNASDRGCKLIVHDIAGTVDRASDGCIIAQSNDEIARRAKVIGLCLPTIETNRQVVLEIAKAGAVSALIKWLKQYVTGLCLFLITLMNTLKMMLLKPPWHYQVLLGPL